MARTLNPCPPAPAKRDPWPGYIEKKLTVQVVTPMFGGGVRPGQPDPLTPIRVPSIRGHLRFWWRATRGAMCPNVEELRHREAEIWGDTENPSPVQIRVAAGPWEERRRPDDPYTSRGRQERGCYGFYRFGPEAYALFSANQNSADLIKEGVSFDLTILWPKHTRLQEMRDKENERRRHEHKEQLPAKIDDIEPDIEAALWTWLNLGGLGARTRRGCGAVYCVRSERPLVPVPSEIKWRVACLLGAPCRDALSAWADALRVYQDFRQSFRGKKHRKTQARGRSALVPGRSYWSEPDSIRHLTGCALKRGGGPSGVADEINTHDHTRPIVSPQFLPAFPRAVLGLPIGFHFADGPGKNTCAKANCDPADVELVPEVLNENGQPEPGSRMGSPVITRAVFHGQKWVPAIIVLHDPSQQLRGAYLVGKQAKLAGTQVVDLKEPIDGCQISPPRNYPKSPTAGHRSTLAALIAFARGRGFGEATI